VPFTRRACAALLSVHLLAPLAHASFLARLRYRGGNGGKISLQKRMHVNTLITEPGTVEIDWGGLYSFTNGNFRMPTTIKYTPEGSEILWGRTEYSLAFDSVTNAEIGGGRVTEFSQSLTATATAVVLDGKKLDLALVPQATFFLRDESGVRLGAIVIARYDTGRHSIGATIGWSSATHGSPTNPAGTWDLGLGYGRRLGAAGLLGKLTPHTNFVAERSTGLRRVTSLFEGVEYQATERLAFDVAGQHYDVRGASPDHQIVFGITLNLGKVE